MCTATSALAVAVFVEEAIVSAKCACQNHRRGNFSHAGFGLPLLNSMKITRASNTALAGIWVTAVNLARPFRVMSCR